LLSVASLASVNGLWAQPANANAAVIAKRMRTLAPRLQHFDWVRRRNLGGVWGPSYSQRYRLPGIWVPFGEAREFQGGLREHSPDLPICLSHRPRERGIIPPLHERPPTRGSHGKLHRTPKILSHARRGGCLAARGARAAAMLVADFLSYASPDAFARHRMALAKLWPINR
jgi:hypothetical protein